ncbi:hypothetical protein WJX81_002715 [Elliptochloris bilobata]|uniref:F-box domain-containing protein n=1 Tax=Elliptochloris bilobata TaxID=381761 RepID=A0AAW1S224_9CHLO
MGISPPPPGLEQTGTSALHDLPFHVLAHVLANLGSASDLAAAGGACRSWRALIGAHDAQWPAIERLALGPAATAPDVPLRWAARCLPSLVELDLSATPQLTERHLAAFDRRNALKVLRLTGPAVCAGPPLANLLARCDGLQVLDLRGSGVALDTWLAGVLEQRGLGRLRVLRVSLARSKWHQRRKGALERIAAACPALAELDLSGARALTGAALEAAAAGGSLSRLTRLALAHCEGVQHAGPMLATLGRLQCLDLSYTSVQDADVAVVSAHCPRLADLNLSGCLRVRGWGLAAMAGEGSLWEGTLRRLCLADMPRLEASELRKLLARVVRAARDAGGTQPLALDLSSCGGACDEALLGLEGRPEALIAELAPPQLSQHIATSYPKIPTSPAADNRWAAIALAQAVRITRYPMALRLGELRLGLAELRIARRGGLDGSALAVALAPHTETLRALSLAGCGALSDAALAAVPAGVRELSLVCCERVTGWGLTRLTALRTLRLSGCSAIELGAVQAR